MTAPSRTTVVLVHGFWHGSWCWERVTRRLASRGTPSLAVDVAGHGLDALRPASAARRPFDAAFAVEPSPVTDIGLERATDLLADQVRTAARGRPVVLVSHSFGGVVAGRFAQRHPELVERLVYVAAVMPASEVPGVAYLSEPEQRGDQIAPLLCAEPSVVGALRLDTLGPDPYRAALRSALYADVAVPAADSAIDLLSPDAPARLVTEATELTPEGWGSVPRSYVLCTEDNAIRPELQRRFVREADAAFPLTRTAVVELESSHSPFLSHPDLLADLLT